MPILIFSDLEIKCNYSAKAKLEFIEFKEFNSIEDSLNSMNSSSICGKITVL